MFSIIAAVKTKRKLVQVLLQMLSGHSAMMSSSEPCFKISNGLMNPRQNFARSLGRFLHFWTMQVLQRIETLIGRQGIRVDLASRCDIASNEPGQSFMGQVWQDFHANPASMIPAVF